MKRSRPHPNLPPDRERRRRAEPDAGPCAASCAGPCGGRSLAPVRLGRCLFVGLLTGWVLACGSGDPATDPGAPGTATAPLPSTEMPPTARVGMVDSLRSDLAAERHPSDGGGRAWLEPDAETGEVPTAVTGRPGTWTIRYQAGPLGIARGGMLYFQVSPFWGWSTPHIQEPELPGFTEVSTTAEGVELEAATLDAQLLGIGIGGRALAEGEEVRIVFGAGAAGAVADRFAERQSRFWIAVDGDGDGVRRVLADSPAVDVLPGPAAALFLTLPSTAYPGDRVPLTVAVLDNRGNTGVPFAGEVEIRGLPAGEPLTVRFDGSEGGRRTVDLDLAAEVPGVVRLEGRVSAGHSLRATSNPLQVSDKGARILWADLHNHSNFSDGTALPEDLYVYARDVAALDVVALTDHDHWGMLFLDQHGEMWQRIRDLNRKFHEPGRFVPLLAYEWTSWIYGHRHVLYFEDDGELLSSMSAATESPRQLWEALRAGGRRVVTIAHHPAGGPVAIDWSIPPDPELEPVAEVSSVHGSSEALDSPALIYSPEPGHFVRDALDRGYRLGFVGSSDSHDGHPGFAHLASPTSGLAAILSEDLTREAVYQALRERRTYATNGSRILLRTVFGGYRMGADIPVGPDGIAAGLAVPGIPPGVLVVQVQGTAEIDQVDVIRSGKLAGTVDCNGDETGGGAKDGTGQTGAGAAVRSEDEVLSCSFSLDYPDFTAGEYLYVRIVQEDGGLAWSSPFFFVEE